MRLGYFTMPMHPPARNYCGHDWADAALARRSMTLMAEEVMPRVNRALAER